MSKLPDKVEILGTAFAISYQKRIAGNLFGETLPDTKRIKIKSDLTPAALEATLFHEMMHAALFMSGLSQIVTEDMEEAIIRAIEHGLAPHIRLKCLEEKS